MSENMVPVFIGLDYHKNSIQVCVMDNTGRVLRNKRCDNDIISLAEAVGPDEHVEEVAIESCCGAADLARALCRDLGWKVSQAQAGIVKKMRCNPDKTDYSDARLLADLCRVGYIPRVWTPCSDISALRTVITQRAGLVKQRKAIKLQILAILRSQRIVEPKNINRWTRSFIEWLKGCSQGIIGSVLEIALEGLEHVSTQIARVESLMRKATANDPIVKYLMTVPGIGEISAWVMRAKIGVFSRFNSGKQLSRYAGVTPRNASSGDRMADAGLIRGGDPILKTTLIQIAHQLIRREERWKRYRWKLTNEGKKYCVIVAAVANRWLRGLYHDLCRLEESTAI